MEQTARTTFWWTIGAVSTTGVIALWLNYPPSGRFEFMGQMQWAWPITELLHFLGLAGFIGLRTAIDLRLTNRAFSIVPLRNLIRKFMPAIVFFAAITVVSGLALYAGSRIPDAYFENPIFTLKVIILGIALFNLWYLHAIVLRTVQEWDTTSIPPVSARISAYVSMSSWAALIVLSMLMPYADWVLSPWVD